MILATVRSRPRRKVAALRLKPPKPADQLTVFKQAFVQLLAEHEQLLKRVYPSTWRERMFRTRLSLMKAAGVTSVTAKGE